MFPNQSTKIRIKTQGLPDRDDLQKTVFEFFIVKHKHATEMNIPGEHRGYDLCLPDSKVQEDWLNSLEKRFENRIRGVWYCVWKFEDESVVVEFLDFIKPNIIETEYS